MIIWHLKQRIQSSVYTNSVSLHTARKIFIYLFAYLFLYRLSNIVRIAQLKTQVNYHTRLFSGTLLNVRKQIFERMHRKSSRYFSPIVNK